VGNGGFRIVNIGSGKCLDVEGASRDDGANIQQWSCGGANQAWTFRRQVYFPGNFAASTSIFSMTGGFERSSEAFAINAAAT
jgi:Ricin-type beta-trefoil lectin domain-like